ncbi:GNAT family N-acetyltransferase [Pelagovum pacificum]|uniref:GNAT family N-acetyltransferase n=1 Tax=Pelagovum pacificum TaxID=2588711 RepID=A0A5C5GBR1_9RHOB|nr:GNAT family N-acetyltransferase [Pelagovum pacificum]QQA44806.1 GNAT family N-acetyltransferase [Pelagovum pacificum]TNY32088.1 GNAT family N-acetyltransferase [Pelagovum pacificum]
MAALQQHPLFAGAVRRLGGDAEIEDGVLVLRRRICGVPVSLTTRHAGPPPPVLLVNAERPDDAVSLAGAGYAQIMTPAYVAELDLSRPLSTIRAGLNAKWRNRLVVAERAGTAPTLRAFDDRDMTLLHAEARQRRARGYRALPSALIPALAAEDRDAVLSVRAAGAGMIFVRHGDTATYLLGLACPEARASEAHRLMLWSAIGHLKALGVTTLDLGTVDTETSPGLARFKIGTGATIRLLGGTWLRLPRWRRAGGRASA